MFDFGKDRTASSQNNLLALFSEEDAYIFELLLQDAKNSKFNELTAMLSYAQYAQQKHQFINSCKRQGFLPSNEELRAVVFSFKDENNDALKNLTAKSEDLLNKIIEEYSQQAITEKVAEPVEKIVKENTKFWVAVQSSIVASFVYSLIIALILFTATAALPNTKFSQIIRILFEVEDGKIPTSQDE